MLPIQENVKEVSDSLQLSVIDKSTARDQEMTLAAYTGHTDQKTVYHYRQKASRFTVSFE